jgi:hypothetical protein
MYGSGQPDTLHFSLHCLLAQKEAVNSTLMIWRTISQFYCVTLAPPSSKEGSKSTSLIYVVASTASADFKTKETQAVKNHSPFFML